MQTQNNSILVHSIQSILVHVQQSRINLCACMSSTELFVKQPCGVCCLSLVFWKILRLPLLFSEHFICI